MNSGSATDISSEITKNITFDLFEAYKSGNVIVISFRVSGTVTDGTFLFQLPEKYRISYTVRSTGVDANGSGCVLILDTNGDCRMSSNSNKIYPSGQIVYILE